MTGSAIVSLNPIIRVLYNKDGSLRSFLTFNGHTYTMFSKVGNSRYYYNKHLTILEYEEMKELFKSPIEKIDLDQLEKY